MGTKNAHKDTLTMVYMITKLNTSKLTKH
jgi:hypothetical protein